MCAFVNLTGSALATSKPLKDDAWVMAGFRAKISSIGHENRTED